MTHTHLTGLDMRRLRQQRDWTQTQLGVAMGYSEAWARHYVSRLEARGSELLPRPVQATLALTLGITRTPQDAQLAETLAELQAATATLLRGS